MARVYATRAQLVAYAPPTYTVPEEPEATRVLTRASQRLDSTVLKTAVYEVDVNGLPTDAGVIEAFRDATCAQVVWWSETGSETGSVDQYDQVSIGSARLSRRSGSSASTATPSVAPAALDHLALLPPETFSIGVISTW